MKNTRMKFSDWTIQSEAVKSLENSPAKREIMTLKNSYLAWKAIPVWSESESCLLFNHAGHDFSLPNPQFFRFYVNQQLILFNEKTIVDSRRQLNLRNGSYIERYTVRVPEGYVSFGITKYLDPINPHCFGLEGDFSASFSGELRIESLVSANGSSNLLELSDHLLTLADRKNKLEISLAAKSFLEGRLMEEAGSETTDKSQLLEKAGCHFETNSPLHFDKLIVLTTNQETENPGKFARQMVESLPLDSIKAHSNEYWQKIWKSSVIKINALSFSSEERSKEDSKAFLQSFLHLSIFQLNQEIGDGTYFSGRSLSDFSLWQRPEIEKTALENQLNSQLQKENQDLENFLLMYHLWTYDKLYEDKKLLNNGGLELLLGTIKSQLNRIRKDENGNYHLEDPEGETNFYRSLSFLWLLHWLVALPKEKALNLRSIAEKTIFDAKTFEKARKVLKGLYINLEQVTSEDFLKAVDILGLGRVRSLLKYQPHWPFQESDVESRLIKLELKEDSGTQRLALAGFYAANHQVDQAEKTLIEALARYEKIMSDEKNILELEAAVLRLLRHQIAGISISKGSLNISPKLPKSWERLLLRQRYMGAEIEIEISQQLLLLKTNKEVSLKVYGKTVKLATEKLNSFVIRD